MILTRVRIAIAVLGLLGASFVLWRIHDALAEQRVRRAVEAVQEQTERETREQVEAEYREQLRRQRNARLVAEAQAIAAADDRASCPSVPADYFVRLNAIGKVTPGHPAGEMSRAARMAGRAVAHR